METKLSSQIALACDPKGIRPSLALYDSCIHNLLKRLLSYDALDSLTELDRFLPLVKWWEWEEHPRQLSIALVTRQRAHVGKFFHELINRWILSVSEIKESLFFTTDFCIGQEVFTAAEIVLSIENGESHEWLRSQLPHIQHEIFLGVSSQYCAQHLLEMGGLAGDSKVKAIQESIAALVKRKPEYFDYDLFEEMQQLLFHLSDEFKVRRSAHHLLRLILLSNFFKKDLWAKLELAPDHRHVRLKILRVDLHDPLGVKRVLGVIVGMNFLKENEIFEESHLLKALSNLIPNVQKIEGSDFISDDKEEHIRTIYLEIEKNDGAHFVFSEIQHLRESLTSELKSCVERWVRPVFMPRNEEEVMRNILTLCNQVKFLRDIPQMILTFDQQSEDELYFSVVLVRVVHLDTVPVQQLFEQIETSLKFVLDRVKKVGLLRKRYPKEATVFRVELPVAPFLRKDQSVDLFAARQTVLHELQKVMGEVRDYNGGMIAKQIELLSALKQELKPWGEFEDFLVENFFHSVYPIAWQSTLPAASLRKLFLNLLGTYNEEKKYSYVKEKGALFFSGELVNSGYFERIFSQLAPLQIPSSQLVSTKLELSERLFVGYMLLTDDEGKQDSFISLLKQALDF